MTDIFPAVQLPAARFGLPELTKAEILAVKALESGTANEGQQKTALDVIVRKLCSYGEVCAQPELLQLHEGRRIPGALIVQILRLRLKEEKPKS